MGAVKWIKLNVDMFDDEKIKIIQSMPEGDSLLIVWIKLITLAGKTNNGGYVYINENMAYTDEMLATIMNKPTNIIHLALSTFTKLGMIENDEKGIYLVNFEKHQSLEKMEKIKEQTRLRVAKYRAKLKENNDVTQNVTQSNAIDIDKDIDKDIDIEKEIYKEKEINIFDYYQNELGSLSPNQYESLNKFIDDYGIDKVKEAIDISCNNNVKTFNYFSSVLKNDTYQKKKENFKKDNTVPSWMDKEIKSEKVSDEELEDLEKDFEIFS